MMPQLVTSDQYGYTAYSDVVKSGQLDTNRASVKNTGITGDDQSVSISLGANRFRIYGVEVSSIDIGSNGLIRFGSSASAYSNNSLSTTSIPSIYPFWDDLYPPQQGQVLYEFTNNSLRIEWRDLPGYSYRSGTISFQVEIGLNTGSADGEVVVNYYDAVFGSSSYDNGQSATVGISGPSGFLQVSHNQSSSYLQSGKSLTFRTASSPSLYGSANTAPTTSDISISINEDEAYLFSTSSFSHADPDAGDSLKSLIISSLPQKGVLYLGTQALNLSNGPITIASSQISSLKYIPGQNEYGEGYSSFKYKTSDQQDVTSNESTLTFNVSSVNDSPRSRSFSRNLDEDSVYQFTSTDFFFEDDDPADVLAHIEFTSIPTHGQLLFDGSALASRSLINLADISKLLFVPAEDENGLDYAQLGFRVYDQAGLGSEIYSATFDVYPVPDSPSSSDLLKTVNEDEILSFYYEDYPYTDPDIGDRFTYLRLHSLPTKGSITFDGAQINLGTSGFTLSSDSLELLKYRPEANENGLNYSDYKFSVGGDDNLFSSEHQLAIDVISVQDNPTSLSSRVTLYPGDNLILSSDLFPFNDPDIGDYLAKVILITFVGGGQLLHDGVRLNPSEEQPVFITPNQLGDIVFVPTNGESSRSYAEIRYQVADQYDNKSDTEALVIDLIPRSPTISAIADDDIINREEAQNGVAISGFAEGCKTVRIVWEGTSKIVDVDSDGSWSTRFSSEDENAKIPADSDISYIRVIGYDANATESDEVIKSVVIDTQKPDRIQFNRLNQRNEVNSSLASEGLLVTGKAEENSHLRLYYNNSYLETVTDPDGNWHVVIPALAIPQERLRFPVKAVATDRAGNTSNPSLEFFEIDLVPPQTPTIAPVNGVGIYNLQDSQNGFNINGQADPHTLISLTSNGVSLETKSDAFGEWKYYLSPSMLPLDTAFTITAVATDDFGNTSQSASRAVLFDLAAPPVPSLSGLPDNFVLNEEHLQKGLYLSGLADQSEFVDINLGRFSERVSVDSATLQWSINIPPTVIRKLGNDLDLTVASVDLAENHSPSLSYSLSIDTRVPSSPRLSRSLKRKDSITGLDIADGISLTGTAGDADYVVVEINNATYNSKVLSGEWQLDILESMLLPSQKMLSFQLTAYDVAGNSSPTERYELPLYLDETKQPTIKGASRIFINALNSRGSFSVEGNAEENSLITLDIADKILTTRTDRNGKWRLNLLNRDIPADGSFDAQVTAMGQSEILSQPLLVPFTVDRSRPTVKNTSIRSRDLIIEFSEELNRELTKNLVSLSARRRPVRINSISKDTTANIYRLSTSLDLSRQSRLELDFDSILADIAGNPLSPDRYRI